MEKISHNMNKNKLDLIKNILMSVHKIFYKKYTKKFLDCCKIFFAYSNNIVQSIKKCVVAYIEKN